MVMGRGGKIGRELCCIAMAIVALKMETAHELLLPKSHPASESCEHEWIAGALY